jgi:hypothetical protein
MVLEELSGLLILATLRLVVVEKHHLARRGNDQMALGTSVGGRGDLRKTGLAGLAGLAKGVHRRCGAI